MTASSYQCQICPCAASYIGLEVAPILLTIQIGAYYYFYAEAEYGGCWDPPFYSDVTSRATWTSGNTSVATVNSYGQAHGVGGGSTTISAQFRDATYLWTGSWCTATGLPCFTSGGTCNVAQITGPGTIWW